MYLGAQNLDVPLGPPLPTCKMGVSFPSLILPLGYLTSSSDLVV